MTNVGGTAPVDAFAPIMMNDVDWRHHSFNMNDDFGKFLQGSFVEIPRNVDSTSKKAVAAPPAPTNTQGNNGGLPMTPENLPIIIEKIDHYIARLQKLRADLASLASRSKRAALKQSPHRAVASHVVTPPSSISPETSDSYSIQSHDDNYKSMSKEREVTTTPSSSVETTSVMVDATPPTKKRKRSIDLTTKDGPSSETEDGTDPYVLSRREQNRLSAKKCRERKKQEMSHLKNGLSDLRDENEYLKRFVESKLGRDRTQSLLEQKRKEIDSCTSNALITPLKKDPFNRIMGPTELKFLQTLRDDALSIVSIANQKQNIELLT